MKSRSYLVVKTLVLLMFFSCTQDFDEINVKPSALPSTDVSARYFVTNLQTALFAPNRFPYWRGPLIHGDRFAGHHTFGNSQSWWNDGLSYVYHAGYTNATYNWLAEYNTTLTAFLNFVKEGGTLENSNYYAVGLIMKGLYYQVFTDVFGMVPFSEASNPNIATPQFDSQPDVYRGIIADLNQAIDLIGNDPTTGDGIDLLSDNDLFFGGNLQSWKKLANSLKLRLGLRALGASSEDFSAETISSAINNGVLVEDNALLRRDLMISQWSNAVYGDIWHNFGAGSNWNVGEQMINLLRDNNDPRLSMYAKPIEGGKIIFEKPEDGERVELYDKHVGFIIGLLERANVNFTMTVNDDSTVLEIPEGINYVGFPTRANGLIKPFLFPQIFSAPADIVINPKNSGQDISPFIVMSSAETNFMIAEAIVKGMSSGVAEVFYQNGLRKAMELWKVDSAEIERFISSEEMASLNGSNEENIEKIALQRWLVNYTNGFESWAIVRDTGFPRELADGVTDSDIFELGDLSGIYPQRMRYGTRAYETNNANLEAAISVQGPDLQMTKLWWAKQ